MQNISPESAAMTFPHTPLPRIIGHPTYQILPSTHLKLNVNAASVFSNRGNDMQGLLALSDTPEIYLISTTGMAFVPPFIPGLHPTNIGTAATNVQIAHATWEHNHFQEKW